MMTRRQQQRPHQMPHTVIEFCNRGSPTMSEGWGMTASRSNHNEADGKIDLF